MTSSHSTPYRQTTVLTVLTAFGLSCFALLDMLYIPGGIAGMYGVGILGDGSRSQEMIDRSILIRGLSGLGQIPMFIFTTICFCMLVYRYAKNARALGFDGFQFEPGWAVGWFFIPFAHLWMPYIAVREIWQSSLSIDPDPAESEWWKLGIGVLFRAWWATWIFGNILTNVASRLSRSTDILMQIGMSLIPVAALLQVASAILCICVVVRLTKRQEMQFTRIQQGDDEIGDTVLG